MTRLVFPYVSEDYLHKISKGIFVEHIFDTNILQEYRSFHTKREMYGMEKSIASNRMTYFHLCFTNMIELI